MPEILTTCQVERAGLEDPSAVGIGPLASGRFFRFFQHIPDWMVPAGGVAGPAVTGFFAGGVGVPCRHGSPLWRRGRSWPSVSWVPGGVCSGCCRSAGRRKSDSGFRSPNSPFPLLVRGALAAACRRAVRRSGGEEAVSLVALAAGSGITALWAWAVGLSGTECGFRPAPAADFSGHGEVAP